MTIYTRINMIHKLIQNFKTVKSFSLPIPDSILAFITKISNISTCPKAQYICICYIPLICISSLESVDIFGNSSPFFGNGFIFSICNLHFDIPNLFEV